MSSNVEFSILTNDNAAYEVLKKILISYLMNDSNLLIVWGGRDDRFWRMEPSHSTLYKGPVASGQYYFSMIDA